MLAFTILGFLNVIILENFNWSFREILIASDYLIFWQQNSSLPVESEITWTNFFLQIIPTFVLYTTENVKDMYIELSLITGILSLWLISLDFQQKASLRYIDRVKIQEILNHYKAIIKLSKIFSHSHGIVLLLSILNGALFYSYRISSLGNYITTNLGYLFYMLEFLLFFSTLWTLSTSFASRVNIITIISKY